MNNNENVTNENTFGTNYPKNKQNSHNNYKNQPKQNNNWNNNVQYKYNPQKSKKQNYHNDKKESKKPIEEQPKKVNESNKTLIPIVAVLACLILAIVVIQTIQTNKLMDKYAQVVDKYESIVMQNASLNKNISDSLAKIAEKQSNIYINSNENPSSGTNTEIPDNTSPVDDPLPEQFDDTAFLGISVDQETMGYNPIGVKIANIFQYSAAALCGLRPNDVIISIDGQATPTMTELGNIISSHKAGDEVLIEYARSVDGDIQFATIATQLSARGNFEITDQE